MKITSIQISNFLGLKRFKISQPGKWNMLSGDNGAGKSSVLKAIKEAFKSETGAEAKIHIDADKAEILVELTGGVSVKRTITPKSHGVKVTKGESTIDKPQSWLDSIYGEYSFNPIEFMEAPAKVQRDLLLSVMSAKVTADFVLAELPGTNDPDAKKLAQTFFDGIDFSSEGALDVLKELALRIYNTRHVVGQEITRLQGAIAQDKKELPKMVDGDFSGFKVEEKRNELEKLVADESYLKASKESLESLRTSASNKIAEIERLEAALETAKLELEQIKKNGKALSARISEAEERNPGEKIAALRLELQGFEAYRDNAVKIENVKRREAEQAELAIRHDYLNTWHKTLTNVSPNRVMQEQTTLVEGLAFTDDGVTFNGVAISNLSTAEQIKVSLAIAKALSGELKIICIDGFEALSEKSQSEFIETTKDDEYEYFITKVASGELKAEAIEGPKQPKAQTQTSQPPKKGKTDLGF